MVRYDGYAGAMSVEVRRFRNVVMIMVIDDSAKDGGPHFTQCMIGICPLATHSYQNLRLQHKILTIATINLGRPEF